MTLLTLKRMSKRTLLISCLFISSTYPQSIIQIGTGTNTTNYFPMNGSYDYGWSSTIYTKSEINTGGWNNIGKITKLYYQFGNSPSNYVTNNQKIYMGHTSQGSFADGTKPDPTNMTLVYDGTINWSLPTNCLPSKWVYEVTIDASNNKWVSTYAGGLAKFDDNNWTVYNTSNSGIGDNDVYAVAIDASNTKWLATYGGGLVKFDGINWTTYNTGLPSIYTYDVVIDGSNSKWVATTGGVGVFDGSNWTNYTTSNSQLPNNYVYSIKIDNDGNKWIATWGGGLAKFDGTNWTVYNTSNSGIASNNLRNVVIDASGNKWIAAYGGGVSKFDGVNWTTYNTSSGLPSNNTLSVDTDGNGNIWVGTTSGVAKFNGSNWTTFSTSNSSLPSNEVNAVTYESGTTVWISTGDGLAKFDGTNWNIYKKNDWQEIALTTPFDWNNADNLQIYYENRDGSWASNYPTFKYYTNSTGYRTIYKYQDGTFPSSAGTRAYNIPNIKLTISEIQYPFITYTAFSNTSLTTNRTVSGVSIVDADGVNTADGTKPRLYYKRSTEANVYNSNDNSTDGWKYVETSSGSSPFSFTIDYSKLNGGTGVSEGTIIQYFVVAQDLASTPNIGINSGTFNSPPSSVNLTSSAFPISGNIRSYSIVKGFSGEILVGSGQTYTSLTEDASTGLFKALNNGFVRGNIMVKITSNLTETGAVALNQTNEEFVTENNFTISIVPNEATNKTISGSRNNEGLIRLNKADRIIFDGRYNGSGNYLTFINTETLGGTKAVIQLISSTTDGGCTDVTIRNCNISFTGGDNLYCIYAGGLQVEGLINNPVGINHHNLSLIDNVLNKAITGIYAASNSSSSYCSNNVTITGNIIGSDSSNNYITKHGIWTGGINNGTISNNTIFNLIYYGQANASGIYISSSVEGSTVTVSKNKIYSVRNLYNGQYGAAGIDVNSSVSNINISNNVIYDVFGRGGSPGNDNAVYGIRLRGSNSNIKIYYNSVNLYGDYNTSYVNIQPSAIYIGSSCNSLDIRNNIFANSMKNTYTYSSGCKSYAIYSASSNSVFTNINYNDYYASGTQGVLGYLSSDKTILSSWQTATGNDANSKAVNPDFTSDNNLKPYNGSPILSAGVPISVITTDYEGVTRSEITPSIGAYETGNPTSNVVGWGSLHSPGSITIDYGTNTDIFARVFIDGVTPNPGAAENLEVWIGINSENTNPASWHNWTAATFTQQQGNNDEFKITTGAALDMGPYYIAARFRYLNGPYRYGGYSTNGGGFWDGTNYVNGIINVNTFTKIPYIEKFSNITLPNLPTGWLAEDSNNDDVKWITSNYSPKSLPYALIFPSTWSTGNDWVFTPGFNLTAGVTYQISFYFKSNEAGYVHKLQMKYGTSKSSSAMTSDAIFYNDNITNTTHQKVTVNFTSSASGMFFFGWHCFSPSGYKPQLIVDDFTIRVQPSATNTQTITAGSTTLYTFTGTGIKIQFTENNSAEIEVTADKVNASPGGSLPGGLTNLLPQYWCVTTEGTVNGTYCFTLDLTGVGGINNYSTIHLLKRDNANANWTDIGVPTDVSQVPIVKWCYPSLTSFSEFGIGGENDNPLPVQLISFKVENKMNNVILSWKTETEVNNHGYEIERKVTHTSTSLSENKWEKIGFVQGSGNSNSPKEYTFTDNSVKSGIVSYRLKQIDSDGTYSYSHEIEVQVDIPKEFRLSQNYPNPFNPSTTISFQLPEAGHVTLKVFDILGREITTLVNKVKDAGYYTVQFDGSNLVSGVYIYTISTTGIEPGSSSKFIKSNKMLLIK
jgi:hypothetical protein